MASAADDQVQASGDVERIAAAIYETTRAQTPGLTPARFDDLFEASKRIWRAVARELLLRDVIRVGRRPQAGEPPMEGQTTIEDALT